MNSTIMCERNLKRPGRLFAGIASVAIQEGTLVRLKDTDVKRVSAGLRAVRDAVGNAQLVAIGGISHTNARAVIEAGAGSVAVMSALLSDPAQISDATRTLIHLCQT